jgi:hypothetical protein
MTTRMSSRPMVRPAANSKMVAHGTVARAMLS